MKGAKKMQLDQQLALVADWVPKMDPSIVAPTLPAGTSARVIATDGVNADVSFDAYNLNWSFTADELAQLFTTTFIPVLEDTAAEIDAAESNPAAVDEPPAQ